MSAYIKTNDIDSRRTIADYQVHRVIREAIEYLEKEDQSAEIYSNQTARLIAMHLRAYADMIDEFASVIEIVEEEERLEVQEALKHREQFHFQDEFITSENTQK